MTSYWYRCTVCGYTASYEFSTCPTCKTQYVGSQEASALQHSNSRDWMFNESTQVLVRKIKRFQKAIRYLNGCGTITLKKIQKANRISGADISTSKIYSMWEQADHILPCNGHPGGKDFVRYDMKKTMEEGICSFTRLGRAMGVPESVMMPPPDPMTGIEKTGTVFSFLSIIVFQVAVWWRPFGHLGIWWRLSLSIVAFIAGIILSTFIANLVKRIGSRGQPPPAN